MHNRYFINLTFVGTDFHGWQIQKNAITVQGILDNSLSIILKEKICTVGCGRTDAGVHAMDFYLHFDTQHTIGETGSYDFIDKNKFLRSINSMIGKYICVKNIFKVDNNFHSRFNAISRTYMYRFHYNKNPFLNNFSLELKKAINLDIVNKCCNDLICTGDFSSFTKRKQEQNGTICTIYSAYVNEMHGNFYFYITANRFLWNMVRRIVNIILNVSDGVHNINIIKALLSNTNLDAPFNVAPPYGLYLYKVQYPEKYYLL